MEMRDRRLANLRVLLREEREKRKALALRIKKSPAQVSQWLSGYRTITEETAREIERNANKPLGWLDGDASRHSQSIAPPAPDKKFSDRHAVTPSDFALLTDISMLPPDEQEAIRRDLRERAEKWRAYRDRVIAEIKGKS